MMYNLVIIIILILEELEGCYLVEIFILTYEKLTYKISFFIRNYVSFFKVKNQNEPITIKIHSHKTLLVLLNLLLAIMWRKKQDGKAT